MRTEKSSYGWALDDSLTHLVWTKKALIKDTTKEFFSVAFSSLNHRDVWITKGLYPGIKKGIFLGSDGVIQHNNRYYYFDPGDQWGPLPSVQDKKYVIKGLPYDGTLAEYISLSYDELIPIPEHLSPEEAATIPLAGLTAYRALLTKGQCTSNKTVLISGIGGGVATMAMQFALSIGAKVIVTSSSTNKLNTALNMGAIGAYNYNDPQLKEHIIGDFEGVDIIIDGACGDGFNTLLECLNPGGKYVFYGGTMGKTSPLNPQMIFWKQLSILGTTMGSPDDFKAMHALICDTYIKPIVDTLMPISELPSAIQRMNSGRQMGKIAFKHP